MNQVKLPNFFLVGAAKAGTTTLYEHLKTHKDIYFPELKEPSFLSFANQSLNYQNGSTHSIVTDFEKYKNLYRKVDSEKAIGDASSPSLFLYEETVKNIKTFIPDYTSSRIIILLRNPAERAFSQYMMRVRNVREPLSFEEALLQEEQRRKDNFHFDFYYYQRGLYYEQVKHYQDNFEHVGVWLFEDLINNSNKVVNEVLSFLDLPGMELHDTQKKSNTGGVPKFQQLNKMVFSDSRLKQLLVPFIPQKLSSFVKGWLTKNNMKQVKMDAHIKKGLVERYRENIENLNTITPCDVSHWLESE